MINKLLKNYMEVRPNDIFINYNNKNITYENIAYSVESRIKSMQTINIKKKSIVGIYIDNSLDLVEVLFACIEIQAHPLIIPSKFTEQEISNLSNQIQFDYFITNWSKAKNLKNHHIPTFPIEELSPGIGGCTPSKIIQNNLNQIACLLLTSGTTGMPKITQISIKNMIASHNAWNKIMEFDKKDIYLNCLPLHHIGGLSIIFRALFSGFKIVIVNSFNEELIVKKMIKYKVNIVSLVPTMLSRILQVESNDNLDKRLRAIILGGSNCSSALIKRAIKKNFNIYKSYGMTESSSGISGFWVKEYMSHLDSSGIPHDQIKYKIIKDEILIKGPSIIEKYYDGPIIKDWYCTNDIGYIDSEGFLYVLGRKNQAISGGENIDLKEIEETINKHPKIRKTIVKSIPDDEWGNKIIAYVSSEELDLSIIKTWLKTKISNHKIPKEFIFIDEID